MKMNAQKQLEALQNAANYAGGGAVIHQKQSDDKRKTKPLFFAQVGQKTISPVLDYDGLNHFLLGLRVGKNSGAAPELLAALESLLQFVEIGEGRKANDFEQVHAARAAIAKAKGAN
jgi:hypothetical protein